MKKIKLTKNMYSLVSNEDFEDIDSFSWHAILKDNKFYASRTVRVKGTNSKRHISMHRQIMGLKDRNIQVDHINGDPLDNRRENLRPCTQSQNNANKEKSSNNTSGYKGVFWHCQLEKWRAQIGFNGKSIYLGVFEDIKMAANAYNEAAKKYFGEFSLINQLTK